MIIDCDSHILPKDAFDHIERKFADIAPRLKVDDGGRVRGMTFPGAPPMVSGTTPLMAAGPSSGARLEGDSDVNARLRDLDKMSVDHQIILPQFSGWWSYLIEPKFASAIAHSWNVSLCKIVSDHPDRFSAIALVALQDVDGAIQELEWAKAAGCVGVTLDQTVPEHSHPYGSTLGTHREVWPVFAWCAENEFPIMIHNVSHGHRLVNCARFLSDGLDFFAISEPRMNMLAMITTGLLDRYPALRIVQAETGTAYIPTFIEELDRHFGDEYSVPYDADESTPAALRAAAKERSGVSRFGVAVEGVEQVADVDAMRSKNVHVPSWYFKKNYYWTIETEEDGFCDAVRALGSDRFLFATDYPHDDPGGRMKFRDRTKFESLELSDREKSEIEHENAEELFRLTIGV